MKKLKNYLEFQEALHDDKPEAEWSEALKALWYAAKGNWEASHQIVQDLPTTMGSLIHAYLHRKEGDECNAGYWYRRANKSYPKISVEAELQEIIETLL